MNRYGVVCGQNLVIMYIKILKHSTYLEFQCKCHIHWMGTLLAGSTPRCIAFCVFAGPRFRLCIFTTPCTNDHVNNIFTSHVMLVTTFTVLPHLHLNFSPSGQ